MPATLDISTVLMTQGRYNSNQSFPGILVYPRQLSTTMITVALQTPPVGTASFIAEVASTLNGSYTEIGRLAWPAGVSESKRVPFGVNVALAQRVNPTAVWLRILLVTSGALTGAVFLSKPSDGGPGLGSRS